MKLLVALAILCLTYAGPCGAFEEPSEGFLDALRERGYYDVALDYLDEMATSDLASKSFLETLPFEKAQTLILSTARIRNREQLEKRLSQAESLLEQAEAGAPTLELKARAQDCRGDLLFRRARHGLNLSGNDRLTVQEKETALQQVRGNLRKALQAYGTAKESYRQLLDDYQLDLRDPESKRRLKRLRGIYTVVRVKMPQILEQLADTLEVDDPEREKSLSLAADEFKQLWLKYPNFPAGLDSCLYAARCLYKQQEYAAALSYLQEIFNLPDSAALRTLKIRAMVLAADCWAKTSPYPYDDVIANLESDTQQLTRREQREPEWLRIQLELAQAYHAKAAALKEQEGDRGRIRNLERDASRLVKSVARSPGEHRPKARQLIDAWKLGVDVEVAAEQKPIRTFAEARQRGLELMTELEGLHADVIDWRQQLAGSPGGRPDTSDSDNLQRAQQQLQELGERCLQTLDRALRLADPKTSREDINHIRYLQAACYYILARYYEAALVGEFLVERYPTVAYSRPAGVVAIRSCALLYDQADPEDKRFERERLQDLAGKVIQIWPGTDAASSAAATLARLLLADRELTGDQLDEAARLVEQVDESSPDRASLQVRLGTKLWFAWRKMPSTEQDARRQERLQAAIEALTVGLDAERGTRPSLDSIWGSLFLAEALLQKGNLSEAVQRLESVPLALIRDKHPALLESESANLFTREAFRVAAKAYLTALENEPGDKQWIDKLASIVQAMQSQVGEDPDQVTQQDATNLYRLIAAQLDQQLEAIEKPDERKQLAGNLSGFLGSIQMESADPNTVIWAGTTLLKLAQSIAADDPGADTQTLLNMAVAALQRAAEMDIDDEKIQVELKRQQAIAKRELGQFQQAVDELVSLLRQSPNAWPIQMDAAQTLQMWGTASKSRQKMAQALTGMEKFRDPRTGRQRNLVWGWTRLSDVLRRYPKLSDAYYQAVLGAVETRLQYGLMEQNQRAIAAALKKLNRVKAQDDSLGGPVWKARFDELEQRIRQHLTSAPADRTNN